MLIRPLLLLALITGLALAEDRKPETPPGQAVAAEHKASPPANDQVETELAKQAAKAHADYWAIAKENDAAGLTHYGQKDLVTNPRAKKQDDAQRAYMSLLHEALVEFFSIAERRTQMKIETDPVKHTQDKDASAFNGAILTYPWEIGDKQAPQTAGIMYARKHGIPWLLKLSGGAR